ncbi:hypothetical protein PV783_11525 [Chitinophaga sp. CC14]|uniref:hypothetical protein n=1 Tax=Chitinophaga sp. CC14 TaxID=3029199 RepID=UPI003B7A2F1F
MITGINVKQSKGEILLGISLDEFIQQLQALPSKNGWVNLILSPRKTMHPKGYTHSIHVENRKSSGKKEVSTE